MTPKENPLKTAYFQSKANSGKARCEIGWDWKPLPLSDYDLWYVVSGRGEMRMKGQAYPLAKGDCFLVRPGDQPLAEQDSAERLTVIYVHFQLYEHATGGPFPLQYLPPIHTHLIETYYFESLLNRVLELDQRQELWKEDEFDGVMKQIFMQLYRIHEGNTGHDAIPYRQRHAIARVVAYIHEEIGRRVAHEELASMVNLSAPYLSVLFKKITGTSIKEYITQVRLERAMHLLTETSMNVSQVSEVLGYTSLYLFSKQFKQKYGLSPSHFHLKAVPSRAHGKTNNDRPEN